MVIIIPAIGRHGIICIGEIPVRIRVIILSSRRVDFMRRIIDGVRLAEVRRQVLTSQ